MKRTPLSPGAKSLQRGSTFDSDRKPLERKAPAKPRRAISPASPAQRAKVAGRACVVCAQSPCDPAHLIDRSLGGDDDPRAVIPLCRLDHRRYDLGELDLLPYLEPHFREELAYAVERAGLMATLRRVTNERGAW